MKWVLAIIDLIVVVGVVGLGLTPAGRALADIAPPQPPPGTSIQNGDAATNVQMVSENVLMTITDDHAAVEATFQMRNQGTALEALDVRFPIGNSDSFDRVIKPIQDFAAYVDGQIMVTSIIQIDGEYPGCIHCPGDSQPWATWHVNFRPQETVTIGVTYIVQPDFVWSASFASYYYILETGAGWHGAIGEGTIIVRFPYEVNPHNAYVGDDDHPRPDYYTISGTDVIWHFKDLEPGRFDNVHIRLMLPPLWRALQSAEKDVQQHPDSLDAHVNLAHALVNSLDIDTKRHMLNSYGENEVTYARALTEYERVLQMAPRDVDLHLEYVDLLLAGNNLDFRTLCSALTRASSISPDDERVKKNMESYGYSCDAATLRSMNALPGSTDIPPAAPAGSGTPTERVSQEPPATPTQPTLPSGESQAMSGLWPLIAGGIALLAGVGAWLYLRAKSGAH